MSVLVGRRILVLEDEYYLASELERILEREGAVVIGPMSALAQARYVPLDRVDAAVLDTRVRDGMSYDLARQLRERGIPFVFASGQNHEAEPDEWRDAVWVTKTYEGAPLIAALLRALAIIEATR